MSPAVLWPGNPNDRGQQISRENRIYLLIGRLSLGVQTTEAAPILLDQWIPIGKMQGQLHLVAYTLGIFQTFVTSQNSTTRWFWDQIVFQIDKLVETLILRNYICVNVTQFVYNLLNIYVIFT